MTVSIQLETSKSLAIEYKDLALKQNPSRLDSIGREGLYNSNITLILLNACLVEGILRTWLTQEIKKDLHELANDRMKIGKTSPSKPEIVAENHLIQVELNGGWQKIIDQYRSYMAVRLSTLNGFAATNHLFTLRNVIGHGTSIVIPKNPSCDPGVDYTDSWQKKLESVSKYLTDNIGANNVLDALNKSEISKHFWENSKVLLDEAAGKFSNEIIQSSSAYKSFDGYTFGFRN